MQLEDFNINEVPEEDAKLIDEQLDEAMELGLEVEVIYWALIAMKKNPELTPGQAFVLGLMEWIK